MWDCPICGASVDSGIDRCWGCGGRRPVDDQDDEREPVVENHEAKTLETERFKPAEQEASGRWACPKCNTRVEPGFDVCWNCGTSIDGEVDPRFVRADEPGSEADADRGEEEVNEGERVVCPKCEGVMREGFVPDYTKEELLNTQLRPGVWVAGRPQSSFWTGTWTGEERYPVRAFRCDECGYLEFYARD